MQLVLPNAFQLMAFQFCHDQLGHHGVNHTLTLLKDHFFWPQMEVDVWQHVAICAHCLCFMAPEVTTPLVHVTTHHALELIHMDYLKLEPSSGQQENVLVITDHYTHYAQAYPTRNQTARTIAYVFWEHFVLHYGFPD